MNINRVSGRVVWFAGALLSTLLTVGTVSNAHAGKIYRCVDEVTKKVTMSDSACYNEAKPADKVADADKKPGDKKDVAKSDDKKAAQVR